MSIKSIGEGLSAESITWLLDMWQALAHQTAYLVILMDCDLPIKDGWQAGAYTRPLFSST
jgi:CheY-like chemotaxis protein